MERRGMKGWGEAFSKDDGGYIGAFRRWMRMMGLGVENGSWVVGFFFSVRFM